MLSSEPFVNSRTCGQWSRGDSSLEKLWRQAEGRSEPRASCPLPLFDLAEYCVSFVYATGTVPGTRNNDNFYLGSGADPGTELQVESNTHIDKADHFTLQPLQPALSPPCPRASSICMALGV